MAFARASSPAADGIEDRLDDETAPKSRDKRTAVATKMLTT
jgi:hypothetical protein